GIGGRSPVEFVDAECGEGFAKVAGDLIEGTGDRPPIPGASPNTSTTSSGSTALTFPFWTNSTRGPIKYRFTANGAGTIE
ncbi:MAG: hypothetical protein AAF146_22480, partial [Bacteroidota bacterium]